MRDLQRSHLQLQARNGNDAWEVLTLCLQLQSFKFCLSSAKILHVDPSDQATSSPTHFPLFLVLDTTIACYCQVCSSNDVEAEHPIVKMLQWSMAMFDMHRLFSTNRASCDSYLPKSQPSALLEPNKL